MLDLSKIEAGELTPEVMPFDLTHALKDVAGMMATAARAKRISFEIDAAPDLPRAVEGDATRLKQILVNLISNAIKFTDRGGVLLQVRQIGGDEGHVKLRLAVHDTGIGIPPGVQARLFAPFVQADASTTRHFGGTALGLSMVKHLTELLGGQLGLSSTPGHGSEFWVELPFVLATPQGLPLAQRQTGRCDLQGSRVLVVDDSEINLEVARRVLQRQGAVVTLAGNGQEAFEVLRDRPGEFDVVLMDVDMPVLDGHQATRRIRGELGLTALPILALTAGALTSERERSVAAGMVEFVTKPFDPPALVRSVRRHVRPRGEAAQSQPAGTQPRGPGGTVSDGCAWPEIEGIDSADVEQRLGGDIALFATMLDRLFREFIDIDAPAASDPAQTCALQAGRMHKLRGCAGQLGARLLLETATQAEAACRAGDTQRTSALTRRLGDQLRRLQTQAAPLLDTRRPDAEPPPPDAGSGPADPEILGGLSRLLRQHSLAAVAGFRASSWELRRLFGPDFEVLRGHVDDLRFDEAAAMIDGRAVSL